MTIPHDLYFLTVENAFSWFTTQEEATFLLKRKIVDSIKVEDYESIPAEFHNLTLEETHDLLDKQRVELMLMSSFQIISAAEGRLKYDFQQRVTNKSQTPLCKDFKNIYTKNHSAMKHIDVERDIIDIWKKHFNQQHISNVIGQYRGALKFRHWIAHGRFWKPVSLGRHIEKYHPNFAYKIVEDFFNILQSLPEKFYWE